MLELRNVSAGYGATLAIREISLTVAVGEVVAIVGPNGAGKSSLLRTISGMLRCATGTKLLEGADITTRGVTDLVKLGIVHVPEGRRLFGSLSVHDNLLLGSYSTRRERTMKEIEARMGEVFELFPVLASRLRQTARTLSGGEQQMLAIGRGLMGKPRYLLLDEPTLGLAPVVRQELVHTIGTLNQRGLGILLVEENVDLALGAANRVAVLELGRITLEGRPEDVRMDPKMREAYLGRSGAA